MREIKGLDCKLLKWRCCIEADWLRLPLSPWISDDLDAGGHAEPGELVQAAQADGGFGLLGGKVSGSQVGADDGLVAEHCGFGQRSPVIAGLFLPFCSTNFSDAADRLAAGGRWVFHPAWRTDRGPFARRE